MKKLVSLIISLLIASNCFNSTIADSKPYIDRAKEIIEYDLGERKEVFNLVQPVIELYLKRHDWKIIFPNMEDSISHAMACIFVSESSNGKGHPARSSLWMLHNNPFGLTARQGVTKKSWELINHKRVVMDVTFRTFDSFEDAIESLIWDYLMRERFSIVRQSGSVKEFLYNLYKGGYMTNYNWPKFAYNEIYLKSI
jgi:hypothetical protein